MPGKDKIMSFGGQTIKQESTHVGTFLFGANQRKLNGQDTMIVEHQMQVGSLFCKCKAAALN